MWKIQSIIIPKKLFSYPAAVKWVNSHDFEIGRVDETIDFWRFRQHKPPKNAVYSTKILNNNVGLVMSMEYMPSKNLINVI